MFLDDRNNWFVFPRWADFGCPGTWLSTIIVKKVNIIIVFWFKTAIFVKK